MTSTARLVRLVPLLAALGAPALGGQDVPLPPETGPIARIRGLVAEFGPPVLLVEPERPEHPHDRRACASMSKALVDAGFRCADSAESRDRRRELADGAVSGGGSPARAIAIIDRLDVDFVLRVSSVIRDAGSTDSYGIRIAAAECTVSASLVRSADQSTVEVEPWAATARSRSPDVASLDAEAAAVSGSAIRVAEAVVSVWEDMATGRRPWIVELESPSDGDAGRLAANLADPGIVILENRPGVRSILSIPGGTAALRAESISDGTVVLRRPGYALVVPSRTPDWVAWTGAGLGAALVFAGTIAIRRRSASRSGPGAGRPTT